MSAHTLKRMRALQYTSLHSVRRPPPPMDKEADALHSRWSWLQEWVGALPSFDKDVPVEYELAYSRDAATTTRQLRPRAFLLAPVPDAAFGSILLGTAGDAASTTNEYNASWTRPAPATSSSTLSPSSASSSATRSPSHSSA